MKKILFIIALLAVVSLLVVIVLVSLPQETHDSVSVIGESKSADVRNTAFVLNEKTFFLQGGVGELQTAPGVSGKETLSLFDEPVYADFDSDGDTDVAVWLAHETGGSGVFYYAALALLNGDMYDATNALYLGDRIAPQTIDVQDGRAVYNFAEHRANEPMTTQPSVGKSVWIHYDAQRGEIGEWVSNFEGEFDYTERFAARVDRVNVVFEHKDFSFYRHVLNGVAHEGELNTERGYGDDPDATVYVLNWQQPEAQQMRYVRFTAEPNALYLLDSEGRVLGGSNVLTRVAQ